MELKTNKLNYLALFLALVAILVVMATPAYVAHEKNRKFGQQIR
ncbi:MAG: hypothetical protein ACI9D5_002303 [Candidatus Endobugula sp.]|jgi:hypothetical protein